MVQKPIEECTTDTALSFISNYPASKYVLCHLHKTQGWIQDQKAHFELLYNFFIKSSIRYFLFTSHIKGLNINACPHDQGMSILPQGT